MRALVNVPAGRAGAVYDIVVTAAFATPWTAALMLQAISTLFWLLVQALGVRKALKPTAVQQVLAA